MEPPVAPDRPQYTCIIRLPFPRGDFVDPPPVDWNASKDKALWKIISKAANSKDLNWPELSSRFDVSLPFLLQQAAWLYERHFSQMRAQMKKLGASNAPSPVPPPEGPGVRPASRSSRAPSALSTHSRDSPQPPATASVLGGPNKVAAPPMSRTPSTRTVTQSRLSHPQSPRDAAPSNRPFRPSFSASTRKASATDELSVDSPTSSSAVSSSSDDDVPRYQSVAKSQVFRRPPDLRTISSEGDVEDDFDDDNSSGGLLPFASRTESASIENPASTLRTTSRTKHEPLVPDAGRDRPSSAASGKHAYNPAARRVSVEGIPSAQRISAAPTAVGSGSTAMARTRSVPGSQPSSRPTAGGTVLSNVRLDTRSSAANPSPQTANASDRAATSTTGPSNTTSTLQENRVMVNGRPVPLSSLSPRHRAELARLSPSSGPSGTNSSNNTAGGNGQQGQQQQGPRSRESSSTGTPSMGSSFSDLDVDAGSVTQSALEDALLSNMRQGGSLAGRMSTFGQAIRSRYLPQQ